MKRIMLFIFVLGLMPLFASAQDEKLDEYSFETSPLQEANDAYFTLGGAYSGNFLLMKFDEANKYFNNILKNDPLKMNEEFEGNLYMHNLDFFIGTVVVPNLQVGVSISNGSKLIEKDFTQTEGNNTISATVAKEINVSRTALNLEYGIIAFKHFAILPSVGIGWGSYSLETNVYMKDYNWTDIQNTQNALSQKINQSFIYVNPQLSLEYAVWSFAALRVSAGYNANISNSWELNNKAELKGVPDKLNTDGVNFQVGLRIGLFNY